MSYVYLTTGPDAIDLTGLGNSDDRITGLQGDINPGDSIDGGPGEDVLELIFGTTFDLRVLDFLRNVERIKLDGNATAFYNLDALNIYIAAYASTTVIHGGSGNETIEYNAGGLWGNASEVYAGAGNDKVVVSSLISLAQGVKLDGGDGDDTLAITEGTVLVPNVDEGEVFRPANIAQLSLFTGFEHIVLSAGDDVLLVNQAVLAGIEDIDGGTGTNEIRTTETALDLSGLTLTNIQKVGTSNGSGTSFTLASGLSNIGIAGGSGNDIFHALAGQFGATNSLDGGAGTDTLSLDGSGAYDLAALASFSGIETISSTAGNTTVTVNATILGALTSIDLGTGSNTLKSTSTTMDLTGKTLAHVQTLQAINAATTFTVDNNELVAGGRQVSAITGLGTGNIVSTTGTTLDLTGVTLTNIQTVGTSNTSGTSFTLDSGLSDIGIAGGSGNDTIHAVAGQFGATNSLDGGAGTDTLSLDSAGAYDLAAIASFSGIEKIASTAGNTTVTVNATILGALTSIDLGTGSNTLKSTSNTMDLTGKTLAHVQTLQAINAATTFTVDNNELVAGGGQVSAITGVGTGNIVSTTGTILDLTGVTLANIQTIKASNAGATTLTGNAEAQAIVGAAGDDILTGGGGADQLTGGGGADTFRDTAAHLGGATITDLTTADSIDLTDVALSGASASFSAGLLTVKSGGSTVAQIALTGSYADNFHLESDGGAGLSITYAGVLSTPSGPSGPSSPTGPTFGSTVRLSADGSGLPLVGTLGNDNFVGSSDPAKVDTVMQNGTTFGQNTITRQADGSIDISGPNGTDHLTGIERIVFDDGVLLLDLPSSANTITSLYRVMFDRTPDEAGIKWQIGTFDSGASLDKIAGIFLGSEEASFIRLPNLNNADFVGKLYGNAFDRQPDASGLQYWIDALEHGASRESIALFFVQSPEEVELVGQANKAGVFSSYPEPGHV